MTRPSAKVRAELERALDQNRTRLGDVYRLSKGNLSKEDIARELGVRTSNFVYNQRVAIDAILEGEVTTKGPQFARNVARSVRALRARHGLSKEARQHLDAILVRLERTSGQVERRPARPDKATARPTGPPVQCNEQSLRDQVDAELRSRVRLLVSQIMQEIGLDAEDYLRVRTSQAPNDLLAALILDQTASTTFLALRFAGRLDLSLEAHVRLWARDLPIRSDVVDRAAARLEYFGDHLEGRA